MASFQPRFPEIRHTIGRLVVDRANSLGLTRREVVTRLGYQGREAKGHQTVTEFMAGENLSVPFMTRLANLLEIDQSTLDAAVLTTVRELDAEAAIRALDEEQQYRSNFRPHLQVQCERRIPSPIFAAAMIGVRKLRVIELPIDLTSADDEMRDETAREAIVRHQSTSRGVVPCFGEITGYVLVLVPGYVDQDFGISFDCRGRRIGSMASVQRLPDAHLGRGRVDGRLTRFLKSGADPGDPVTIDDLDA